MRRALLAFAGTAAGTTLIIAAKLGPRPAADAAIVDFGQSAEPSSVLLAPPPLASTVSPAPVPAPASAPAGSAPVKPSPTKPATGTGAKWKDGTFPGTGAEAGRYGTIKVTIVISAGKITDITATYPTGGQTGSINARAIPKLRQEALAKQSAAVSTVSGATYTSDAYKKSLQAALDSAKA